ncbi:unnamed protein product [Symbiodinium microadriaticum]|nr:unnamed protein product [Symbiodinium microadriaticum]
MGALLCDSVAKAPEVFRPFHSNLDRRSDFVKILAARCPVGDLGCLTKLKHAAGEREIQRVPQRAPAEIAI